MKLQLEIRDSHNNVFCRFAPHDAAQLRENGDWVEFKPVGECANIVGDDVRIVLWCLAEGDTDKSKPQPKEASE